jgi:hypothetical protein
MANSQASGMGVGHRSATAAGVGLEFVLIAFQHLLPEWIGAGLWWVLLLVGIALIVWGVWPFLRRKAVSRSRLIPIIIMGFGIFLFFGGAIWYGLSEPTIRNGSEPQKNADRSAPSNTDPPTLFSLFMSELRPSKGLVWNSFSDFDIEVGSKTEKVRIFYNIYDDVISNSKYMAFYVPGIYIPGTAPSSQTIDIIRHISTDFKRLLNDIQENRWAQMKTLGETSVDTTKDIPFSGKLFFYCVDNLSIEQLAELRSLYQNHGVNAQFKGMDYTMAVWDSIQLGRVKPPPQYELRDGMPQLKN